MSELTAIKIPDIGGHEGVDVIDVSVKVGDIIALDDTLITLETDKATMDVPADVAGEVKEVKISVGDKIKQGDVIVLVATSGSLKEKALSDTEKNDDNTSAAITVDLCIPDIGTTEAVDVIEVAIKKGVTVAQGDTLITLETDKATMDVPAESSGVVQVVNIQVGDKVKQGDVIAQISSTDVVQTSTDKVSDIVQVAQTPPPKVNVDNHSHTTDSGSPITAYGDTPVDESLFTKAYAGPAVRKMARELGVDLAQVHGSARKGRIVADDVKSYVKKSLQQPAGNISNLGGSLALLPWPKIDFAQFGETEQIPLSRIKKISGQNLARNWVMIPHVTQHEDADMTDLEAFRQQINSELSKEGIKLSPLVFIIKACVKALQTFPEFNASLEGENLTLKRYYHIGFAADTPNGLVVPVIRNADQKGLKDIARELTELSKKAREGKLKPQEMQGASFTISSLGGIGGTYFTPIINAPEVAILGVCQSRIKPVWQNETFVPRLLCPLSLSYDHRVIDGASACRFMVYLSQVLADFRRIMV